MIRANKPPIREKLAELRVGCNLFRMERPRRCGIFARVFHVKQVAASASFDFTFHVEQPEPTFDVFRNAAVPAPTMFHVEPSRFETSTRPPARGLKSKNCSTWNLPTSKASQEDCLLLECRQTGMIGLDGRSVPRGTNGLRDSIDLQWLGSRDDSINSQTRVFHVEHPPGVSVPLWRKL
jgi:hypothetical protein